MTAPPAAREAALVLDARVGTGPDRYRFRTADGVVSPDSFRSAELLALEEAWSADGRVLVPQAGYGVVGAVLAATADVVSTEASARAARLCRVNARRNGVDTTVELLADLGSLDGTFDAAVYVPKPYTATAVGKRRAADALAALRPGGRLLLAGRDRDGLARYERALRALCAPVDERRSAGDDRLLAATRPETVDPPPFVEPRTLSPTVGGVELSLRSVPGLFSASGLDRGTRLLAETVTPADGERVLDLACGYGPLGVHAGLAADVDLVLSDDDRVATRSAECSLRAAGVDGRVVTADCARGVSGPFDRVLCNPPTHAGDGVLADLFAGAADVLAPDGRLDFVRHRALSLRRHLDRFRVERRTVGEEHAVLSARPRD